METREIKFKTTGENNPNTPKNKEKLQELHAIFNQVFNIDTSEQFADLADELKEKYPDYKTYRLYHLLAGSTVDSGFGDVDKFDFPDNEVENFLLKMRNSISQN